MWLQRREGGTPNLERVELARAIAAEEAHERRWFVGGALLLLLHLGAGWEEEPSHWGSATASVQAQGEHRTAHPLHPKVVVFHFSSHPV